VPAEGLEPPTNGLQITHLAKSLLITQSLAALATPHSSLIQSHFGHSQSESGHKLVTRHTTHFTNWPVHASLGSRAVFAPVSCRC